MGVYSRYKSKGGDGLRALVELLETTPSVRRQKMIEVGMEEDAQYTKRALDLMLTFQKLIDLPTVELAEVMLKSPPRTVAYAIHGLGDEVKAKFIGCCNPQIGAAVRDYLSIEVGPREAGGAQLKLVEITRGLEKRGVIRSIRLPME